MRKKWLSFLFVLVFSLSFSSAACRSVDDTLFSLSFSSNAHAQVVGESGYGSSVCYQEVFGVLAPSSPSRECTGSNKIVGLSSVSNAHLEKPELDNYNVDVCYQGVSCRTVQGDCDVHESLVVKLSSETNAHGGVDTSGYEYSVCCTAPGSKSKGVSAQWSAVVNDNLVRVDSVRLSPSPGSLVYPTLLRAGGTLSYKIFGPDNVVVQSGSESSAVPWSVAFVRRLGDAQLGVPLRYNFSVEYNGNEYSPSYLLPFTFCGDGVTDVGDGESCDSSGVQAVRPSTPPYGEEVDWCNASSCVLSKISGGVCGDGEVQGGYEDCDLGDNNGNKSAQGCVSGKKCSYCSVSCSDEVFDPDNRLQWQNLNGRVITNARPGDTVLLVDTGSSLASGTFVVQNKGGERFTEVSAEFDDDKGFLVGELSFPSSVNLATFGSLRFYEKSNTGLLSNTLTLSRSSSKGDNGGSRSVRVELDVGGLSCGSYTSKGSKVITADFFDSNDLIKLAYIKVNGVEIDRFVDKPSRSLKRSYNFDKAGVYTVEAFAENVLGEKASVFSNILVVGSSLDGQSFALACISEPKSLAFISNTGDDYVGFDASSSKAYRVTAGVPSLLNRDKMSFSWSFSDGTTNPFISGKDRGSFQFRKAFSSKLGSNSAKLTVSV